jgi:hypothetical protein
MLDYLRGGRQGICMSHLRRTQRLLSWLQFVGALLMILASTVYLFSSWWLPFLIFAIPTAVLWWRDLRSLPRGHCQHCGCDLTGNVSVICPECGKSQKPLRQGSGTLETRVFVVFGLCYLVWAVLTLSLRRGGQYDWLFVLVGMMSLITGLGGCLKKRSSPPEKNDQEIAA